MSIIIIIIIISEINIKKQTNTISSENQKLQQQIKELKSHIETLSQDNNYLKELKNETNEKLQNCYTERNNYKEKYEVIIIVFNHILSLLLLL